MNIALIIRFLLVLILLFIRKLVIRLGIAFFGMTTSSSRDFGLEMFSKYKLQV